MKGEILTIVGVGLGFLGGFAVLKTFNLAAWAGAHRGDLVLALAALIIVGVAIHYARQKTSI